MEYSKQIETLRGLARELAEYAARPEQAAHMADWKAINGLRPRRPMFMMDQLPYPEMNNDGEFDCVCEDWLLRHYEWSLREQLYRCRHMPDDRVVQAVVYCPRAIAVSSIGMGAKETQLHTEGYDQVVSHAYESQFLTEEDIEGVQFQTVSEDKAASAAWLEKTGEIFGGILDVRHGGVDTYGHVWDVVSTLNGVEQSIIDLYDRPDYIHRLLARFFAIWHNTMDQYEALGLLNVGNPLIHCTGAYSNQLPGFTGESYADLEGARHTCKSVWTYGAAQLFSMVSPAMHDEFEIFYQKDWYARFGLGYYGCCEPLDKKIGVIRKLPNVRKISMSPWVSVSAGAEALNGDYVYSSKPNPAFLSSDTAWNEPEIRKYLQFVIDENSRYGNGAELILKDVSTTGHKPSRLWDWARICRELCGE